MWLNEGEIDHAVEMFRDDPVLGPASRFLSEYRHLINSVSDGWPYWTHGVKCTRNLCDLIHQARLNFVRSTPGYVPATRADVEKAAAKILRFMQREPQMNGKTPPVLAFVATAQQYVAPLMKKLCVRCEESVFDYEEDALAFAENYLETSDFSNMDFADAISEMASYAPDMCNYCDHMCNKDD